MQILIKDLDTTDVSSIYDVFNDYLHRISLDKLEN